jgi:hypothetical protein
MDGNVPPEGVLQQWLRGDIETFLTDDYCAIRNEDFFVRGLLHLPILGAAETFRWGVWGSLSRQNFTTLLTRHRSSEQATLPPMFSWLSTPLPGYSSTLNLKMLVHVTRPDERPEFQLERTDHPLSQEYHHGISPERVREFMREMLRETE